MSYIIVVSSERNNTALDSKSCSVSTGISLDHIDSAMGRNEGGGGESEEDGLGKHFDCCYCIRRGIKKVLM